MYYGSDFVAPTRSWRPLLLQLGGEFALLMPLTVRSFLSYLFDVSFFVFVFNSDFVALASVGRRIGSVDAAFFLVVSFFPCLFCVLTHLL